jgi:hypothetical protein
MNYVNVLQALTTAFFVALFGAIGLFINNRVTVYLTKVKTSEDTVNTLKDEKLTNSLDLLTKAIENINTRLEFAISRIDVIIDKTNEVVVAVNKLTPQKSNIKTIPQSVK